MTHVLSAPSFAAAGMAVGDADLSRAVDLSYPKESSDEARHDYERDLGAVPGAGQ